MVLFTRVYGELSLRIQ